MKEIISEEKFREVALRINDLIGFVDKDSVLNGLTVIAHAFSLIIDTYAGPNSNNPKGMYDDKDAFRKLFADMIAKGAK